MFVYYRFFLSFRFHWALLACLRWSLGTLGLPWVPLDGHWGSISHLWGSIGAPLERHWAPFVACGGSLDAFRGHWGSLLGSLGDHFERNFSCCSDLKTFEDLYIFRRTKIQIVSWTHYLWVQMDYSKFLFCVSPKMHYRVGPIICGSKCTSHKFVYQTFVTNPQFLQYQTVPRKSILK